MIDKLNPLFPFNGGVGVDLSKTQPSWLDISVPRVLRCLIILLDFREHSELLNWFFPWVCLAEVPSGRFLQNCRFTEAQRVQICDVLSSFPLSFVHSYLHKLYYFEVRSCFRPYISLWGIYRLKDSVSIVKESITRTFPLFWFGWNSNCCFLECWGW